MLKKILQHPHTPFWLLTISIAIGLTLPVLIQDGMFMDAMLYTSVSHNLSQGIGTFWFPQFSIHNPAGLAAFHEQPPLVFGIQSIFFRLLGDSMYVERFYTFLTLCIAALLIRSLWKEIFSPADGQRHAAWLPVLFWITIPVCFWSYSNNMHENTMSIFVLCAVLFIYKGLRREQRSSIYLLAGGFFIFLATLSKGIPGFFPLTVPVLYWLVMRKASFGKAILRSVLVALPLLLAYGILILQPASRESLSTYFFVRVLFRINDLPTVDSHFYILGRLLSELLPQLVCTILILLIGRGQKMAAAGNEQKRTAVFFLLIGLMASVPLMLTLVQKGFYMVPALPFLAIGLALFIAPFIHAWIGRISVSSRGFKIFIACSALLICGALGLSAMQIGKSSRNAEMLKDVYTIGSVVPANSIVSIPQNVSTQWDLKCYLVRYFNIGVDTGERYSYYIAEKSQATGVPAVYKKIKLPTLLYDLYKK